jgi:hypothetical protein
MVAREPLIPSAYRLSAAPPPGIELFFIFGSPGVSEDLPDCTRATEDKVIERIEQNRNSLHLRHRLVNPTVLHTLARGLW